MLRHFEALAFLPFAADFYLRRRHVIIIASIAIDIMQIAKNFTLAPLIFCAFNLFSASAVAADLPPSVLDAMQRGAIPPSAMATFVQAVNASTPLLAVNDTTGMNPASTMKLVTTAAALELLGPTYKWKTRAYTTGTQVGDVLRGDLVIKGGGDPSLTTEGLWQFLRRIRAAGIRKIQGNLILDRSMFADMPHDAALFDGEPLKPYNVGPDALLLNYHVLTFQFLPRADKKRVDVSIDPPIADYPVRPPQLSNDACGDWHTKSGLELGAHGAQFNGTFAVTCGEKSWYLNPYQMSHVDYFGAVFRQLWRDVGGSFSGEVQNGLTPIDAHPLAEWESPPLPEVIRDINKFSNNVMARQVLLTIGAELSGSPVTPARGAGVIKTWLAEQGIPAPQLIIDNGAGLSRDTRISVDTMGRMLAAAFHSPLMPELMSSLPLVGYDGTMRKRLRTEDVAGHAHIKTGSLEGVRAIAGYVLAASGQRYVIACIINDPNAGAARAVHDALLQWLYENG